MVVNTNFQDYRRRIVDLPFDDELRSYFSNIIDEVEQEYEVALDARRISNDPRDYPEIQFVWDMAERIEKLLGLEGVADFIRRNKNLSREELALKSIDLLVDGEFGSYDSNELVDLGVRLPLAILTEGMTVAPLDGIKKAVVKRVGYRSFLSVYYAGPIRSAGGTETGLSVIFADYLRRKLGIDEYRASKQEIYRFLEELRLYERFVGSFQYEHSDEKILYVLEKLPVEVTGVATDDFEVLSYRDIPTIETNRLRGGALRVINDGVIGKARKLLKVINTLNIEGWEWLSDLIEEKSNNEADTGLSQRGNNHFKDKVLNDLVIGRPVFSLTASGRGFRLKYGRESHLGLSAVGVHPAAFALLDYFIVPGSQIKLNLPGKGGIVLPSSIASPPVVELNDGSVVEVSSEDQALLLKNKIKKILFLGDIVISYGDFLENNHPLLPQHFDEHWFMEFVRRKNVPLEKNIRELTYLESLELSQKYKIPLNPRYIPYLEYLSPNNFLDVLELLSRAFKGFDNDTLIFDLSEPIRNILKDMLIPFELSGKTILVRNRYKYFLKDLITAYKSYKDFIPKQMKNLEDLISFLLGSKVKLGKSTFVSARLGRPEKVKPREMSPPVNVLFPVGNHGGSQRDLIKASSESEIITVELSVRYCPSCEIYQPYMRCQKCSSRTIQMYYCRKCNRFQDADKCRVCGTKTTKKREWAINLKSLMNSTVKKYRLMKPDRIKGVKKLMNSSGIYEDISKGLLRSKHSLSVFKDGTCRIDITNAPLHSVSIDKIGLTKKQAEKLGYTVSNDNIIHLYPHDIIVPKSAADTLVKMCKFVDELLSKVYKKKPYYKVRKKEDLIGKLVVGLSPHTSCGVIGRIIGFTDANVLYAHPLWHAAKRRDCDGDQDSIMLLLDALLNFSLEYLPESSGGRMDTPMFVCIVIHPDEVDTQVHNLDISDAYPLEFYEDSLGKADPKGFEGRIPVVGDMLGSERSYYKYRCFNYNPIISVKKSTTKYSRIKNIKEKLEYQIKIANLIFEKEDTSKILSSVLNNHIFRDIKGNLRAYFKQIYRCSRCQNSFRRPTLTGKCPRCGSELRQTVSEKSVAKYLILAKKLVKMINDPYIISNYMLLESDLNLSLNLSKRSKQKGLQSFI